MKGECAMKRSYIQLSRAWYRETCLKDQRARSVPVVDNVTILIETEEKYHEAFIEWRLLNGKPCPQFTAYDDAWAIFKLVPDLFDELARRQDKNPTPEEICQLLEELHFEDVTQTQAE